MAIVQAGGLEQLEELLGIHAAWNFMAFELLGSGSLIDFRFRSGLLHQSGSGGIEGTPTAMAIS